MSTINQPLTGVEVALKVHAATGMSPCRLEKAAARINEVIRAEESEQTASWDQEWERLRPETD